MSETPREKFLRNHQEHINIMRAKKVALERSGDTANAYEFGRIIEHWEQIAAKAREAEEGSNHAD